MNNCKTCADRDCSARGRDRDVECSYYVEKLEPSFTVEQVEAWLLTMRGNFAVFALADIRDQVRGLAAVTERGSK